LIGKYVQEEEVQGLMHWLSILVVGPVLNQVMMMLVGEIIYVLTFLIGLFLRVGVWLFSWFYITIWFHLCINVFMSENHGPR